MGIIKKSAWTLHTEAAALSKLFQISVDDPRRFIPPKRRRVDITRSRLPAKRDKKFSEANNRELIAFCKATGCRRGILTKLTKEDLWSRDRMLKVSSRLRARRFPSEKDKLYLHILEEALTYFPDCDWFICHRQDKGGRYRMAPIIGPDQDMVVRRFQGTKDGAKVWPSVSNMADIHSYRADYAVAVYRHYARNLEDIPYDKVNQGSGHRYQGGVYVCRGDEAGKRLDRDAMLRVSKALGHNRVSVVADNYLYGI